MIAQNNDATSDKTKIAAILLNSIEYTKCEGDVVVPADTIVYIDLENSVVLLGKDHVHIDSHEYRLLMS